MSKDFIINELQNIFEDISNFVLNKYKINKEDLQYLDYKFNTVTGLFVSYYNDNNNETMKKEVKKRKKKTTTKRKRVYKTDEVMQVVGDNKDELLS